MSGSRRLFLPLVLSVSLLAATGAASVTNDTHIDCVRWVNAMRSREGLPALRRWAAAEPCLNTVAGGADSSFTCLSSAPGGSADDRTATQLFAPSSFPTVGGQATVKTLISDLWHLQKQVGIDPATGGCLNGQDCSGYQKMRGGFGYNQYDSVACGLSLSASNSLSMVLAYSGPRDTSTTPLKFECGGCAKTKPCATTGVPDCAIPFQADKCSEDYGYLGCVSVDPCDPNYTGPCTNKTATVASVAGAVALDPCDKFKVNDASMCNQIGKS